MSRRTGHVTLLLLLVVASSRFEVTGAAAAILGGVPRSAANVPVLGSRSFAKPAGVGWGTVRPREIFNGGDPSGMVTVIVWSRWGRPVAYDYGESSIYEPSGGYYPSLVRVEVRATSLGRCAAKGRLSYTRLAVRAPSRPRGPLGKWSAWGGTGTICQACS